MAIKNNNDYINIKGILKKYKDAFVKSKKIKKKDDDDEEEDDDSIIYIQNYYTTLEDFIDKLDKNFDNETILFKFYLYIKDLFENYLEALKLNLDKGDKNHIFKKINEYIKLFIDKSSGYLNELLEILSKLRKVKKKKPKVQFYIIIVLVMKELNKLGKECIISDKPFCKYHSLMYFEQSNSYFEKYFPKISPSDKTTLENEERNSNIEEERENVGLLPQIELEILKKESKACIEYIHDIKSGAILLCEEYLKKGVLIRDDVIVSSDKGNTTQEKRYNIANLNRINIENRKIFLSNYEKLLSEIQITDDFTKKEALCIANIMKICYSISQDFRNKERYLLYLAQRCESIVEHLNLDKNEEWYKEFNILYTQLKKFAPKEQIYQELLEEMKKKYPEIFEIIYNNFKNMSTKDFIKFIITNHPYKGIEKDVDRNFESDSPELLHFLLTQYLPDNYRHSNTEDSKLKYCIVQEISKKLNLLYSNTNK